MIPPEHKVQKKTGERAERHNGDETVDVLDSILIQKYASEKTTLDERQLYVGDVNDDGQVDVLDAADIQKHAAEKLSEFKKK